MFTKHISYRKANEKDMEFLIWLRKKTMLQHLISAKMDVSEENLLSRIKHDFEHAKIILIEEQKIGLLKLVETNTEIEIIQIQIKPDHQNKGIGKEIIQSITENASKNKTPVKLSVLKINKAQNLYKNLGFEIYDENEHSYFMIKKFSQINS